MNAKFIIKRFTKICPVFLLLGIILSQAYVQIIYADEVKTESTEAVSTETESTETTQTVEIPLNVTEEAIFQTSREYIASNIRSIPELVKRYVKNTEAVIYKKPSVHSEAVKTISFSDKVTGYKYNEKWFCYAVESEDGVEEIGYILKKSLQKSKISSTEYTIPNYRGAKTYMTHTKRNGSARFARSSKQYALQQVAETEKMGFRVVDGRYCVAIGSHFNTGIGQYFDLVLENGIVIPCVMGDQKSDRHTDSSNIVTVASGCASEFIVDRTVFRGAVVNQYKGWDSKVKKIIVYDKFVEL
jgi:hypothetical protein